ncbi:MAG: phosphoribosyl-AMP cyclohydrolase [Planctomycetales bacterium]|nr:phosphoribosyl-AMP cyclohydrolase [Planctomycetales bacterium]
MNSADNDGHADSTPAASECGPDFERHELIPAIAQDVENGEVLMMAYMNAESFAETQASGRAVYWSRSRQRLWRKGEESGHVQHVEEIRVDCDRDTILLRVRQQGPACHEGYRSCFFRAVRDGQLAIIADRMLHPDDIYPSRTAE